MKKTISLAIITVLTLASFGQAAYAHDSNGDKNDNKGETSARVDFVSRFFNLNGKFNSQNHDKGDKMENDNDGDKKDNDNHASSSHDRIIGQTVNGLAKVTAVNGNVIGATAAIGGHQKSFTINTDANTNFTIRTGGTTLLSNVHVGDLISFTGSLTSQNGSTYSLNASKIRVWGDVDVSAKVTATGTVSSIDASSSTFTIVDANGKTILINSTDLTKFKNGSSTPSTFANLSTGLSVKIVGFWNSLKNIITAIKVKIM